MALAHFSLGKVAYFAATIAALAFFALDPTVQVAFIAAGAIVLTNIPILIIAILNRKDVKNINISMDGNFKRLWDEKDKATADHVVTQEKLSRAEGKAEGATEERDRDSREKD